MEVVKTYINELPAEALYIRTKVFVDEQGFKEEFDTVDKDCVHFVYYLDDLPIATARLYRSKEHKCLSIGRFAVLKEYRRNGVGRKLLAFIERYVLDNYDEVLVGLSSQKRAVSFYESCHYHAIGDYYLDENYPHTWMEKLIDEK